MSKVINYYVLTTTTNSPNILSFFSFSKTSFNMRFGICIGNEGFCIKFIFYNNLIVQKKII